MSKIEFDFTSVEPQLEVTVTVFQNIGCSKATRISKPWPEICEMLREPDIISNGKLSAPMIKLATFGEERNPNDQQPDFDKRSLRYSGNLLKVSGIEADYDAGVMPMGEAVKLLENAGVRALLYSSWGDGLIEPPKYLGGPRWRVMAPFSRELPPEQRAQMVARLNGALGGVLADESFTLAQGFFIGARPGGNYKCKVTFRDPCGGEPIDTLDTLDEIAVYKRSFSQDDDGDERYSVDIKPGSVVVAPEVYAELRTALSVIPADCDNFKWFSVLRGLSRLNNTMEAKAIARDWSTSSPNPEHNEAVFNKEWTRMSRENTTISHRKVMWLANQYDPNWNKSKDLQMAPVGQRPSVLDSPIKPLTEDEAASARLHPRMLVENYLYADLRNIVAAGGVGKTTTLLYEAMNGALGRPIWGHHVPEPFTTVIVTKEDSREILIGRLKIMLDENELGPDERQQVWSRVYVIDLVGEPFKLAETKGQEIRPHWPNLEKLLQRCKPLSPDRFIFDPLMSFSAGESRVNDAEQAIVEAARHILRRFPGCAVDVVHHTGKANARLATTDQYSGRNGSALPDGSRMVAVLVKCSPATFYAETGINLGPAVNESGLKLALPKLNYCAPQPDVLIHRHSFLFRTVPALDQDMRATLIEETKQVNKEVTRESTRYSLVRALTDCTNSEDPKIRYPSRTCVMEFPGVIGKSTSRKSALDELIDMGAVLEIDLTEDQIKEFSSKAMLGGRTTYLTLPPADL